MRGSRSAPFNNPLILALDVDTREEALKWARELGDLIGGIKLGPRLCLRYGAELVREIADQAPVFLDNKHFDIPSTMEAAVRASFDAGASVVTVHALSGPEALKRMAEVEASLNQRRPFRILAVTVLTSWDQSSFPPTLRDLPVEQHVVTLAKHVKECGIRSIVCSPHELPVLRDLGLYMVTPGIRLESDSKDDQKRIATPEAAIKAGAQALVMGRPLLMSENPRETVVDILASFFEV